MVEKVVDKVWGSEEWIVNRDYCGKILNLKKGYQCSMHHHKIKDETFYILSGRVLLEVNGEKRIMIPGDDQLIMPGQRHQFTGLLESKILEFSTHHRDDDSYRDSESGQADLEKLKSEGYS